MTRNYENIEYFVSKMREGKYRYEDGKIINTRTGLVVKGTKRGKGGYMSFDSEISGRRRVRAHMHLVIFAYFHGIEELKQHEAIDHINEDKHDNRIENLQGMTAYENSVKSAKRKFSEDDILEIRRAYTEDGVGLRTLGNRYGSDKRTISDIVKRISYKEI